MILLAAPLLSHAEAMPCATPVVDVASQAGGQLQFRIQSPCRKGELVLGRYGEFVLMERFDGNGNLEFHFDCFLGDREIDLTFMDDRHTAKHFCSGIESALTKVAIVWQDRVDLDLHAFEYAALPGSDYDRSARNPGSYPMAQAEYLRSGRSRGFMSTVSDGQQLGHNVEVYTLPHHPAEARGLIAMAIGLGSRSGAAVREACSNGHREELQVDLDVYVLEEGARLRSYERRFAAQPCDGAPARLATNLVPNIVVGSARPGGL